MHCLIILEKTALASDIGTYLEQRGDEPEFASDGALGLRLYHFNHYDAVVVDRKSPKIDGPTFCRRLRKEVGDSARILMLGAGDDITERIIGLEAGADDCLATPFDLRELYLRLQAMVRRPDDSWAIISAGGITMNIDQHTAHYRGENIHLTAIPFQLLELFVRAHPNIVTRSQIERKIWNDDPPSSSAALRRHISHLRRSLHAVSGRKMIATIHSIGYKLVVSSDYYQ